MPELVTKAMPLIFTPHEFYSQEKLESVERKVLNHYMFREIAITPVSRWLFHLNTRLDEILPMYAQLFQTVEQKYNPLFDVDYTEEYDGTEDGNKSTSTETTSDTDKTGTTKQTVDRLNNLLDTTTTKDSRTVTSSGSDSGTEGKDGSVTKSETHTIDSTDNGEGKDTRTDNTTSRVQGSHNKNSTTTLQGADNNTHTVNNTPTAYLDAFMADKYMTAAERNQATKNDKTVVGEDSGGSDTTTNTGTVINDKTLKNTGHSTDKLVASNSDSVDTEYSKTTSSTTGDEFDGKKVIDRGESGKDTSNGETTETTGVRGTEAGSQTDHRAAQNTRRVFGKRGGMTYAAMIREYRENILNVEMMLVEELEDLFFMIY